MWIAPGISFFSWVVHPLQSEVVEPYPVRCVWFPSRLSIVSRILSRNQWPAVLNIFFPDSILLSLLVTAIDAFFLTS
jgi:hypothetical protein